MGGSSTERVKSNIKELEKKKIVIKEFRKIEIKCKYTITGVLKHGFLCSLKSKSSFQ